MEYESGVRQALCYMSDGTGGQCQTGGSDPMALLEKIPNDLDATYWLAYNPAHPPDGMFHRIEVVSSSKVKIHS